MGEVDFYRPNKIGMLKASEKICFTSESSHILRIVRISQDFYRESSGHCNTTSKDDLTFMYIPKRA